MAESTAKFTIFFTDPNLNLEERETEAQKLFNQMKDVDEIEALERVADPTPPEGTKSLGGVLVGLIAAEVNLQNTKKFLSFLSDRLSGKIIEIEVEANGKKLKVKANSREELNAAIAAAREFTES